VVLIDFNTMLHPMFEETRRVARSEIAEAFMGQIIMLQNHYAKKTESAGLRLIVLCIDHAEHQTDELLGTDRVAQSVRVPHPAKLRTILNDKKYAGQELRTLISRVEEKERREREQELELQEQQQGVLDLAQTMPDEMKQKPLKTYEYRYEQDDRADGVDDDDDNGGEKEGGLPCMKDLAAGGEEPHYLWGKLMEERLIRDQVWQEVFMLIAAYDEASHKAWSSNLKSPVYVRHGPRDVMLMNPSVTNPPGSRRRIKPLPVPDQPAGICWLRRDFNAYGWFAEADKEMQRLVYEYTRSYPDDLIVVHSIDTDFLLYAAVAMYESFAENKLHDSGAKGRVVMANHLAMREFAYAWWCDLSDVIRLAHNKMDLDLFEFTVLTVLGGTDFFSGNITHQQHLKHKEDPQKNKLPKNCLPQFWSSTNYKHFDHFMKHKNEDVPDGFTSRVLYPALNSKEVRKGPLLARVQNIVYRATCLEAGRLKFNHTHYENLLNNVLYVLSSESLVRGQGRVAPPRDPLLAGVKTYAV